MIRRFFAALRAAWRSFWDGLHEGKPSSATILPLPVPLQLERIEDAKATAAPTPDTHRREVWVLDAKGDVQSVEVCRNSRELKKFLAGLAQLVPPARWQYWFDDQLRDWRPRQG